MRTYHNDRTTDILREFSDLGRMSNLFETPITQTAKTEQICPEVFANLLQSVYSSTDVRMDVNTSIIKDIPVFSMLELSEALTRMRNRRGADKFSVIAEMVKMLDLNFTQCYYECTTTSLRMVLCRVTGI